MNEKKKDDPIAKALGSTDHLSREWKRINQTSEQIRKALRPSEELLKASRSFSEQLQRQDALFSKLAEDATRFSLGIEQTMKEFERSQFSIEKFLKPSLDLDLSKLFRQKFDLSLLLGPKLDLSKFAEATVARWSSFEDSQKVAESFFRTHSDSTQIFRALERVLNRQQHVDPLRERLEAVIKAPLDVEELAGKLPPIESIPVPKGAVEKVPASSDDRQQLAWSKWLASLPDKYQMLILVMVLLVLRPLIEAAWNQAVERWLASETVSDQKIVIQQTNNYFGSDRANVLRCVRATALQVRDAANKKAAVIGMLERGQTVEVLEADGVWSLVRYKDKQSNQLAEGWAASAYLARYAC